MIPNSPKVQLASADCTARKVDDCRFVRTFTPSFLEILEVTHTTYETRAYKVKGQEQ